MLRSQGMLRQSAKWLHGPDGASSSEVIYAAMLVTRNEAWASNFLERNRVVRPFCQGEV